MNVHRILVAAAASVLLTASLAHAQAQVTLTNGRVSIVAKDVTVRQILAEWARVGQTKMINAERVPGGPVTLELTNVTEQEALEILLRGVSGYLAAPRQMAMANASMFDRVIVMPTSVAPASPAPAVAAPRPTPVFAQPGQSQFAQPGAQPGQPQFVQPGMPQQIGPDDQDEGVPPAPGQPPQRGPVFNTFPQPGNTQQQNGAVPAQTPQTVTTPNTTTLGTYPGAPTTATPAPGVSTPGMIVQPPPQPGQPLQPGQMVPPVKRPGGSN